MFSLVAECSSSPAKSCTQATPLSGQSANLEGNPIPDKGLGYSCPSNRPGSRGVLPPRDNTSSSSACHMLWTWVFLSLSC